MLVRIKSLCYRIHLRLFVAGPFFLCIFRLVSHVLKNCLYSVLLRSEICIHHIQDDALIVIKLFSLEFELIQLSLELVLLLTYDCLV